MADELRHTPGPWKYVRDSDYWSIEPTIIGGKDNMEGNEADYRLIAAAPEMLDALRNVQKLISEAAMTGFNCKDGDWAERLFFSQQKTSAAIEKATKQN